MKAREHAHLFAAFLAAHGVIELLAVALLLILSGLGTSLGMPALEREVTRNHGDPEMTHHVFRMMNLVFALVGCFFAARVLLSGFAAWGVWKARPWGKVIAIVSCVLSATSFPLGTALAVYGLWFMLGPLGKEWFGSPEVSQGSRPP